MYAHFLIYRNLSPNNIVITDQGVLKLDNFSMCLYGHDEKKEVSIDEGLADLRYTAPELLMGEKKFDNSVDMWSLGCIMGEM